MLDEEDPLAWYDPVRVPPKPSESRIERTVYPNVCSFCRARPAEYEARYKVDKTSPYIDGKLCTPCISVLNNSADKDAIVGQKVESA